MAGSAPQGDGLALRAALVIALATGFTSALVGGIGLSGEPVAYGAVIAALVVRPDFSRWPLAIYPVLLVVCGLGMGIGVLASEVMAGAPQVFVFGLVAALMQLLGLLLPSKLRMLSGVLAVVGVLPLLSSSPSFSDSWDQLQGIAIGLAVGSLIQLAFTPAGMAPAGSAGHSEIKAEAKPEIRAEAKLDTKPDTNQETKTKPEIKPEIKSETSAGERLRIGLRSPFFWRKLVFASLALAIGNGIGAVTPKYLYFGVVLLLNDSIGDTLLRVRDRLVGVSLGILMPLLVFNSIGISSLANGLVLGGTAALMVALGRTDHLRTALISSGVAFVGYGPLVAWYIPHRWFDYALGCGLALAVGLVVFPNSALRRYQQLKQNPDSSAAALIRILPAAREEARWLGLPPPEAPQR
jgi:uncharacterized membrane protein YgaE (UPF0421/DUF939 family)